MIEQQELQSIAGHDVYGSDGERIGSVAQVYTDDQSGQPEWLTVHTGLFGMNESFVPLREATFADDRVEVPYDKSTVKDAPNVTADGHLEPDEERRLYEHYAVAWESDTTSTDYSGDSDRSFDLAAQQQAASRHDTDDAMAPSEERLHVGTATQEAGRARLRKYVEERPVVQKTAEPVERVRLGTETTTDEETVSEDIRKEQIEAEGDVSQRR